MTAPVRDQEWRNQAACASSGRPELWDDSIDGETWAERQERHTEAKVVCRSCPVTDSCAADRLPWESGIWGGKPFPVSRPTDRRKPAREAARRTCPECGISTRADNLRKHRAKHREMAS